ncbi:MAG: hypothetical protein O3C15_12275, partial [Proteobacteria bacterium]|nr:hypothetical protein [Pseudomonadota bacterium]
MFTRIGQAIFVALLCSLLSAPSAKAQFAKIVKSSPLMSSNEDPKETLMYLKRDQDVRLLSYDEGYVEVEVDSVTTGWVFDSRLRLTEEVINWIEEKGGGYRLIGLIEGQLFELSDKSSEYANGLMYRLRRAPGLLLWVENEDRGEVVRITYGVEGEVSQTEARSTIWWSYQPWVDPDEFVSLSAQKGEG